MTLAADKEQALFRAVGLAGKATARAHLAGIVRIHFDAEASGQPRLVVQEGVQLRKGPLGSMAVGATLLLRGFFAMSALRSVSNVGQVLQADEGRGMGIQDMLADDVVILLFQPSLSQGQLDTFPDSRAGALLAQAFLQPRHMIGLLAYLLSAVELAIILRGRYGGKIALPNVNADHLTIRLRHWVWRLYRQGHQQVEALPATVIPEFRFSDVCCRAQEREMFVVAPIGQLRCSERSKLLWRRFEFQFGSNGYFHTKG